MGRCWAGSLGDCNQMSGEHVFSNALFAHGCACPIVIEGVKRMRDGAPTHNADKANILCHRHNSDLSRLDIVAGKVAEFLSRTRDKDSNECLYIGGEILERWLLKTVVNIAAARWAGSRKWRPSAGVVFCDLWEAPYSLRLWSTRR